MKIVEWISLKRDGHALTDSQIQAIVRGCADMSVPDYQLAALAMAIYFRGMNREEVTSLTRHIVASGETLDWTGLDKPVVDKHSTGGIGDKISLILAPLLAAKGMVVPMISGRGLGATGGTLDKLESIPGFNANLSLEQISRQVRETGFVIAGASSRIAPADRRLYALRDVTATVPSIPLITASILGKKLAEGLDSLVLDVKFGSGAFMKSARQATELARSLVSVARELGVPATALLTDMNQPNGRMVGNANELNEAIEVLRGEGPADVRELTLELATELSILTDKKNNFDRNDCKRDFGRLLDSGAAMELFLKMVHAQGGKLAGPVPCATAHPVTSAGSGWISSINAEELGWIIIELRGGRTRLEDRIDHSTGIEMNVRVGDHVDSGQTLANLLCPGDDFPKVADRLRDAISIAPDETARLPLIRERIT
jgi:pyrimidine-nucleoside phosphorylase